MSDIITQVTGKIVYDVALKSKPVTSQCHGYNRQMINVFRMSFEF